MAKKIRKEIIAGDTTEFYEYISGRFGLKIKVLPASKCTTEKQRKQNEKNATDRLRWDINTNFKKGDWWITLEYPARSRPTAQEVRKDADKFFRDLRKVYRNNGQEMRYIVTVGIGKRGKVHVHVVLNYIDANKIADVWRKIAGTPETPYPVMNFKPMDGRKNHADLASYIIKNSCESFYDKERRVYGKRYSKSTNLEKPKIEITEIKAKRWRDLKARKGYYIDKKWSYKGLTADGYGYRHYIMIRLDEPRQGKGNDRRVKNVCRITRRGRGTFQEKK